MLVSKLRHKSQLTGISAQFARFCSVAPSTSKNVIPDGIGRTKIDDYVTANYPYELTGFRKLFQNSTVMYPNNIPLYADGLHKWRPGCGTLRFWHQMFGGENSYNRFDQNSKLIIIDGPKFSGKTKLAKELAEGLGMRYFPKVPETWGQEVMFDGEVKPDWKWNMYTSKQKFYEDPKSACGHSARLLYWIFTCSYRQYINNLLHLLGTGQGVIMEKSCFNSWAYKDALLEMDYITPRFHSWLAARERFLFEKLMPPHLLIYLDVSPEETYKRLQEHGNAYEKKVDKKYVESVDKFNKIHLPQLNKKFNTVTVQYDWNKPGTSEQVLDDFELLDFTGVSFWEKYTDDDLFILRLKYQEKEAIEFEWLQLGTIQPELAFTPEYIIQHTDELELIQNDKKWFRRTFLRPSLPG